MNIQLEKAKDDNITCKLEDENGKWKYIYSKYKPKDITLPEIKIDKGYIILGLGLGYEVNFIAKNTHKKIYVIEPSKEFYNIISENQELEEVLTNPNIIFLFEEEYKTVNFENQCEIINNKNITKFNNNYYVEVLQHLQSKVMKKNKPVIVMFEHVTIAADCRDALENIGYKVEMLKFNFNFNAEETSMNIANKYADYVMSINFNPTLSEVCNSMNIPYICWCVDTPQYGLYKKQVLNKVNFIFTYENSVVDELKKVGVRNIYYMPVAANIKRFDSLIVNQEDIKDYSCDVNFIGNLTISEYVRDIKDYLSNETKNKINHLIDLQHKDINHFVLKKMCTKELVEIIEKEANYYLGGLDYFSDVATLALLLGREQSFQERIAIINAISKQFNKYDVRVYGNDLWNNYINNYCGSAEHFTVMPKIMKLSKINLNITRTFVESGLPMRIFDVLGSKGFLLTNYKKGLEYKLSAGKDFVVYRDLKDLLQIIDYYLNHEEKRIEIANHGYETAKKYHTYEIRVKEIMDIVNR